MSLPDSRLLNPSLTPYYGTESMLLMNERQEANVQTYRIGQLADCSQVSVETIRFYERRGLLEQPPRPQSGYRKYDEGDRKRLAFIRKAKRLGFTLGEIQDLLELCVGSEAACAKVAITAAQSIKRIEQQVRDLKQMRSALKRLNELCRTNEPGGDCPIIQALEDTPNPEWSDV